MPALPKITDALAQFSGDWDKLANIMQSQVTAGLKAGLAPAVAVRRAFARAGVRAKMEDLVVQGVMASLKKGGVEVITDPKGLRKFWLNTVWPGEEMSLSRRLSSPAMRTAVTRTIVNAMRESKSWTSLARSLTDAKLVKADVAGHMQKLVRQSRRAYAGDAAAIDAYAKTARASQRQIERLARAGAPTTRLKKAYQHLLDVTAKGSLTAIDKAVGRAVNAKARYNAERVARTEMTRAYGEGFKCNLEDDEDAVGYRSELSSRHPDTDICDYYASVDNYEMGPGVYPVDAGPDLPYHPHCMCNLATVYKLKRGARPRETPDPKAGGTWLRRQSPGTQTKLLGTSGAKALRKDAGSWPRNLRNYAGVRRPQGKVDISGMVVSHAKMVRRQGGGL